MSSRQIEIDEAFLREARIGIMVLSVLVAVFCYVAYGKLSGWYEPEPLAFRATDDADKQSLDTGQARLTPEASLRRDPSDNDFRLRRQGKPETDVRVSQRKPQAGIANNQSSQNPAFNIGMPTPQAGHQSSSEPASFDPGMKPPVRTGVRSNPSATQPDPSSRMANDPVALSPDFAPQPVVGTEKPVSTAAESQQNGFLPQGAPAGFSRVPDNGDAGSFVTTNQLRSGNPKSALRIPPARPEQESSLFQADPPRFGSGDSQVRPASAIQDVREQEEKKSSVQKTNGGKINDARSASIPVKVANNAFNPGAGSNNGMAPKTNVPSQVANDASIPGVKFPVAKEAVATNAVPANTVSAIRDLAEANELPNAASTTFAKPLPTVATGPPRSVLAAEKDSFWLVSQRVYEDGRYFNALYQFNKDRVESFNELPLGTELQTPSIEVLRENWPRLCPREQIETSGGETLFEIAGERLGQASRYVELIRLNYRRLPEKVVHDTPLPPGLILELPRTR